MTETAQLYIKQKGKLREVIAISTIQQHLGVTPQQTQYWTRLGLPLFRLGSSRESFVILDDLRRFFREHAKSHPRLGFSEYLSKIAS